MDVSALKSIACQAIDRHCDELHKISRDIWSHPELGFQEHFAHRLLTDYFEQRGFDVQKSFPLETSFKARFGNPKGVTVGLVCEYDALPGVNHACGHNLIAEAGVAAALALQEVIRASSMEAQVVVFGTPAEEGGGGKVKMVEAGLFKDVDLCMMVHPAPVEISKACLMARAQLSIVFHGKASHAAAAPWEGINALDAAVSCYTSVSMLRQQMKPSCRMHGVFIDGGEKPNIIPRRSELEYYIRGLTDQDTRDLWSRVAKCAEAAAIATGCTVEIAEKLPFYCAVSHNDTLLGLYEMNAKALGVVFDGDDVRTSFMASTDMGNVSVVTPSIHPWYKIASKGANHTEAFAHAAGLDENQNPTLRAAKAVAMTAIDVMSSSDLLSKVRENFLSS